MRARAGAIFATAVVTTALAAAPAGAAETRAQYVAQADSICKKANPQFKRLAKKYRPSQFFVIVNPDDPPEEPTKEEARKAIRTFTRFAGGINRIFGRMVMRIAFIPIPAGDESEVSSWISGMRAFRRFNDRSNQRFKRHQFNKASLLSLRALESLQNGAAAVTGFGFKVCPAGDLLGEAQPASAALAYAQASGS